MAVSNVVLAKGLLDLRRVLRQSAEAAIHQARDVAGADAELQAALRPYAQAYRDAVQTVLANIANAAQAAAPTNAEKVAYVNSLLTNAGS